MDYVHLGRTGLVSSVIGLGGGSSGQFGLAKGGTRSNALRLIRAALDEGVIFFDGAGICGGVDDVLAEGLGGRRNDVLVSTKVHLGPDPFLLPKSRFAHQLSSWIARRRGLVTTASTLRRRVERTLRTLRTDHIDLVQLHAVSPRQYPLAVERVVPELQKLKAEGKIRAIGVTEQYLKDPDHRMLRAAVVDPCVDTIMVGFNFGDRSAAGEVIPAANQEGIGVIAMFALRSILNLPADEKTRLGKLLQDAGIQGPFALAYRYCRYQPGIDMVLTGTSDPTHLRQNIATALAPPLPPTVIERLQIEFPSKNQADVGST